MKQFDSRIFKVKQFAFAMFRRLREFSRSTSSAEVIVPRSRAPTVVPSQTTACIVPRDI